MTGMSRRQFGRLAAGGAVAVAGLAGATVAGSRLVASADETRAAATPRATWREHGPVVTTGHEQVPAVVADGQHSIVKVVATGWGAPGGGSWTDEQREQVLTLTPHTIVRTLTGDSDNVLDAGAAIGELQPWYDVAARIGKAERVVFELGNEPNIGLGPDAAGPYAAAVHAVADHKAAAGWAAKLCSPALSPNHVTQVGLWWENAEWRAAVQRCDYVGWHLYGQDSFTNTPGEDGYQAGVGWLSRFFADKPWIATEYSLKADGLSNQTQGQRYAELVHGATDIPANLWAATYFHLNVADLADKENVLDPGAPDGNGPRAYGDWVRANLP
jgi:hypothetical protein